MGLVEFLRVRLDEDEQTAREAGECRIAWLTYRDERGQMLYTTVAAGDDVDDVWCAAGRELGEPASVRVVYETARVLADVEAKRRIIDGCEHTIQYEDYGIPGAEMTLRLLAVPYASHPGYREEWKP